FVVVGLFTGAASAALPAACLGNLNGGVPNQECFEALGIVDGSGSPLFPTVSDALDALGDVYTKDEVDALMTAFGDSLGALAGKDTVGENDIDNNAITRNKIKDGEVTNSKLGSGSVSWDKLNGSTQDDIKKGMKAYDALDDINAAIDEKADKDYVDTELANKADQSYVDTALGGKADKVAGATAGNFAGLDSTGNLTDSGFNASSFVQSSNIVTLASAGGTSGAISTKASTADQIYTAEVIDAKFSNYYTMEEVDDFFGALKLSSDVTGDRIDAMNKWVNDMNDKLSAGIASATALTGIDNHLDKTSRYSVGVAGGHYNGQSSVAMGAVIRTSYSSALNFGLAIDTYQAKPAMRVGWNIQW
ncbi:MAG: YadA C-terminal domain-containing protein, partial [Alphaproteobacteria bacterium]|nr:YadA C-terminal domain-containing protein [Alphaproteobacteria bacterium]